MMVVAPTACAQGVVFKLILKVSKYKNIIRFPIINSVKNGPSFMKISAENDTFEKWTPTECGIFQLTELT